MIWVLDLHSPSDILSSTHSIPAIFEDSIDQVYQMFSGDSRNKGIIFQALTFFPLLECTIHLTEVGEGGKKTVWSSQGFKTEPHSLCRLQPHL